MMLSEAQILLLLDRLKWETLYEDERLVLARKRGIGYSDTREIATIEAALSIMLEAERHWEGTR